METRCLVWMKQSIAVFGFLASASSAEASDQRLLLGNLGFLGDGSVQTFIRVNDVGEPQALGLLISPEAVASLPVEDQEVELDLPQGLTVAPYKNVVLSWKATPSRMDVRFLFISKERQKKILCEQADRSHCEAAPQGTGMPEGFQSVGPGLSGAGVLWTDSESLGPSVMLGLGYTFYDGYVTSIMTWIKRALLKSSLDQKRDILAPWQFESPGYYPRGVSVSYDQDLKQFRIELVDLQRESGSL